MANTEIAGVRFCLSTRGSSVGWWIAPTAILPKRTSPVSPVRITLGEARRERGDYEDVPGFCKSASLEEVCKHGYVLTPGRYVGAEVQEDDGEPFAEKMQRLTAQWREQQAEAVRLDAAIAANLEKLGFDGEVRMTERLDYAASLLGPDRDTAARARARRKR